jgi:plasmid maintenance system antidote protein VapI
MNTFTEGEILKVLRDRFNPARGTTQTQVAAKLGFSVQYIQAVLAGSRPLTDAMLDVLGFVRVPFIYAKKRKATAEK